MAIPPVVDAVYYGGYDPGSGIASLKVIPADEIEMAQSLFSLPSAIADGNIAELLDRGDIDATLAQVLRPDEYTVTFQDADYFLGNLIEQGSNDTAALGADIRYWSLHTKILLLALAAKMIPEKKFELRLVTALPVNLYTRENRLKVKDTLSGYYRYDFNGRKDIEAIVKLGYVAYEGQGVLVHCGKKSGKQGVIDIGERTTDIIGANGQVVNGRWCAGDEIGVVQLVDALKALGRKYKRIISTDLAHDVLKAYIHEHSLPRVTVNQKEEIPEAEMRDVIEKAIKRLSRTLTTLISSTWTEQDGGDAASDFDEVFIAGGGAWYFEKTVRSLIKNVTFVPDPQDANVAGYASLAVGLENAKADIWELD